MSARPRKASDIYRAALTKPGAFGVPRVVLACECSDFRAVKLAGEAGWEAVQYGAQAGDTAKMGSAVAWRDASIVGEPALVLGSEAGEGIRDRYVVQVVLDVNDHRLAVNAGHAPPDRAPKAQAQWLGRVDEWPGVVGADFNTWPKTLDRRFIRKVRGVEVLSLLVPNDIPCSHAKPVDIGGDHPAVDVVLWPQPKEN